jgi:TRAP-type uncharacterized transport system substrate-binding protein
MQSFLLGIMAVVIGLLAPAAHAQRKDTREMVGVGTVTILTDGVAEPRSQGAQAVNELAGRLGQVGKMRVLPIAGRGAAANVRDLLYLRGIDLAILNSDVLAFLDETRQYPDARRRIRYVAHLLDQQVYLFVRKEFDALEDLRGRKLVVLSAGGGSYTTAFTLFGLQKIEITLEALGVDAVLDDAALGKVDGALLLSGELGRLRLTARMGQEFRLLPIPMTQVLRKAYLSATVEADEIATLAGAAKLETIAVSTLLAVFDWAPSHSRYSNVVNFITTFFAAIPQLRKESSAAIWWQLDINAHPPGWRRYAAADPARVLHPAQLAELAAIERPRPHATLPQPAGPAPTVGQKPKFTLLATGRAPLADERLPDGGLITALLSTSLTKSLEVDAAPAEMDLRWAKPPLVAIQSLLADPSIDISFPWESADCERPNDLVQASAVLCDNALFTDPILQVVIGLFIPSDRAFRFDTDQSIFGKTICVPNDRDVSTLNANGRNWLSDKRVAVVRQPTLLECASIVQQREADAFIANDLEGQYLLGRLGLGQLFGMAERPLGTRGVHAIVSRDHAQASALVTAVNRGLKELKQTETYATIVRQHLMRLWDVRSSSP